MRIAKTLLAALVVISALAIASGSQNNDPVQDDMKKLQGHWQVTEFIDSSEQPAPADEIKEMTFEFKADSMIQRRGGNARSPAKYTLNSSKTPKWIDVDEGGPPIEEGIYKIEGDELSLCIVSGARNSKVPPRPTKFKASGKAPYTLLVLHRIKK